jgi:ABC-type transport system involved in Fe-S cluster assembly fused permease/ATPase subunit
METQFYAVIIAVVTFAVCMFFARANRLKMKRRLEAGDSQANNPQVDATPSWTRAKPRPANDRPSSPKSNYRNYR